MEVADEQPDDDSFAEPGQYGRSQWVVFVLRVAVVALGAWEILSRLGILAPFPARLAAAPKNHGLVRAGFHPYEVFGALASALTAR